MKKLQEKINKRHKIAMAYKITAVIGICGLVFYLIYIAQTFSSFWLALLQIVVFGALALGLMVSIGKVNEYVDDADLNDVASFERHLYAKAYYRRAMKQINLESEKNNDYIQ